MKDLEYIIVQAGGKGTRLEHLTKNKPKALVPINNLPMIFHLFKKFPDKKFIIITDYKRDVLKKYMEVFSNVEYILVEANEKGTCAGLKKSLKYIPNNKAFLLVWSDLILSDSFEIPDKEDNYIGISKDFECRWSYTNKQFEEIRSKENGVAGLFILKSKSELSDVPKEGEFVRWLQSKKIIFKSLPLHGTREFGTLEEYNKLQIVKCRPFNSIEVNENVLIKKAISSQGERLAKLESNWYKFVDNKGYKNIPKIYEYDPLKMNYINGKNIYECSNETLEEKKKILKNIVELLNNLHNIEEKDVNYFDIYSTYINKTFDRIAKIRDMVPFANDKKIIINGRRCHNVYFYKDKLIKKLKAIKCNKFVVIHGDNTFSNMMIDDNKNVILIDPRGYFGNTKIYGDANYDWAKLYYSIVGNYDQFNLKRFKLEILDKEVKLDIQSNNFEELEDYFFEITKTDKKLIKLLHSIIWLSLTTYAWEDYDSICAAFYNGLYYLEEVL